MVFCKHCGKVSPDGTRFCGECGSPLEDVVENVEHVEEVNETVYSTGTVDYNAEPVQTEPKCWKAFAKVSFILGLIGFICSFTFVFSSVALSVCEPGIVFAILGKKTKDEEYRSKANKGLVFSIIGFVIGIIFYTISFSIFFGTNDGTPNGSMEFIKIFLMK